MADKASSHWPITLTNGVAALFNLFLPLALVRILTPEQVGRYKIFSLYVMLSPGLFLISGLTNGLYHWAGKPESKNEVRQSWTLLLGVIAVLSVAGLAASGWLAAALKTPGPDIRLFFLSAPFLAASAFLEDLMISRGKIWTGSAYASGFNVLRAAGILLAAWWTRDVKTVLLVFFAATVVRAACGCLVFARSGELRPLFSREKTVSALRYAVPVSLAALAGLALSNADQMILSLRLAPEDFAFYAMGCLSIPPLQVLESSVNRVLIPRLSRAFNENERPAAAALFSEGVSELYRYLLPAAVGLIVYAEPIIRILFTERYAAAASFLKFYALFYVFLALPHDVVARARGDGKWILRTALLFTPLSIAGAWLATERWGAMGALGALLAAQLSIRVYSLNYQHRHFGVSLATFLPLNEMLFQTGLATAAAGASLLLHPLFSSPIAWFLVTGPMFAAFYLGGTYAVHLKRLAAGKGPIHVLQLSQTLGLGGLEKVVYSLSRDLKRDDRFAVSVATYDHPDGGPTLAPRFQESGIPLFQWRKGSGFSCRTVFRLVAIILSKNVRVVHAHDLGPLVYGSLGKLLSPTRVKLFLTVHTLLDIEQNRLYRFYFKVFLRFTDRVIAVSPAVRAGLLAIGTPASKVEVIPNGVDFASAGDAPPDRSDRQALRALLLDGRRPAVQESRWILCLARLHPGKGQEVVLDVWRALPPERRAALGLFFVGQEAHPGYADLLREKIRDLPDGDRVVVAGPSDRPEDWIRASDLFISGSLLEGMPLAPLEAIGSGLPAVLSDIEGHRFLTPWAHTFDPKDPVEGARRIMALADMIEGQGEAASWPRCWAAGSAVRNGWGMSAMTASYARLIHSQACPL